MPEESLLRIELNEYGWTLTEKMMAAMYAGTGDFRKLK